MRKLLKTYGRKISAQLKALKSGKLNAGRMLPQTITLGGTPVVIRAAEGGDCQALLDMHRHLSRHSLYFRYLQSHQPTLEEMAYFCGLKNEKGFALVAEAGGGEPVIVALAVVALSDGQAAQAEPAIIVDDRFQGRGLGKAMFSLICRMSGEQGIPVLHAHVHPDNHGMLNIIQHTAYPVIRVGSREIIEMRICLQPRSRSDWLTDCAEVFAFS